MIGYFSLVYMRTNLGLAMTCMINSTALAIEASGDNISSIVNLSDEEEKERSKLLSNQSTCAVGDLPRSGETIINDYGVSFRRMLF
jgi:hypothetical protein